MRLIYADAFKKILSEHEMEHDKRRSFDDYACGASNAYEHASDLLDEMPTVERPHGEWIDEDYGIGKCWATCSECGESTNGEAQDHGFGYDYSFPNFCPNCGADMRDKKDDLAEIIEAVQSIKEGEAEC